MCRYRRGEECPYLLTLTKAPKGKEGRNGEDRKGRTDPLDPLVWGRQNV